MAGEAHAAGVIELDALTPWAQSPVKIPTTIANPLEETTPVLGPQRFGVDAKLNEKIYLWAHGDVCKLKVDAIVNSTNETLNEVNGLSERIFAAAGRDIGQEILALDGCRTGEAKITAGFSLPARHIIHTVGPRFNIKYRTAAESALHNCYRATLELTKEAHLASVAISPINSVRRGYPPEAGAHMALRTIRRFLEHFGDGLDAVVLCPTDEVDIKAYETLLPQYFPRSAAEIEYSRKYLPEDIGNEFGEPVQEERKIRIGDMPRPAFSTAAAHRPRGAPPPLQGPLTEMPGSENGGGSGAAGHLDTTALPAKSSLNQSVISDDDPLTAWADPNREPEAAKESIVTSLTRVQGDHDEQRKNELVQKGPAGLDENILRYNRWLRRAKTENLADLVARNMMYTSGVDALGRPIICVVAKNYSSSGISHERTLLYLIHQLDGIVNKDFVVVFFNTDAVSDNRPDWTFTREVYEILHPKYRRNLKRLYILHPSWWVWIAITILNTFLISDVREKIHMVDSLSILYQHLPASQVRVPDFVADYDRRYYGEPIQPTTSSSEAL